jgi:hypothetical protein
VHHELVPQGQRDNKEFYLAVLKAFARIDKEEKARIMVGKAMDAPPW